MNKEELKETKRKIYKEARKKAIKKVLIIGLIIAILCIGILFIIKINQSNIKRFMTRDRIEYTGNIYKEEIIDIDFNEGEKFNNIVTSYEEFENILNKNITLYKEGEEILDEISETNKNSKLKEIFSEEFFQKNDLVVIFTNNIKWIEKVEIQDNCMYISEESKANKHGLKLEPIINCIPVTKGSINDIKINWDDRYYEFFQSMIPRIINIIFMVLSIAYIIFINIVANKIVKNNTFNKEDSKSILRYIRLKSILEATIIYIITFFIYAMVIYNLVAYTIFKKS